MRWLLCDYGEVLCRAQPEHFVAAMAEALGMSVWGFSASYWEHRPPYDRGDVTAAEYWKRVSGRPVPRGSLQELVGLDVSSWLLPEPEALDATARAAERGMALALFSNAPIEVADAIDRLPWLAPFSPRMFSCRLRTVKPESGAYRAALEAMEALPEDVHFIDDREANVSAASGAGINAILYRDPTQIDAIP
ncbi:MAG: HAD-IA family hydrolase [Acidimicrobiales bacterium]